MALLLDLSHTSHTRARTGIQRVARALYRELSGQAVAACFDPYGGRWRPIENWERENLRAVGPSAGRGARWPLLARVRGQLRRSLGRLPDWSALNSGPVGAPTGVLVPEIFSADVSSALPALFAASPGPRVALFHDAIALQYPEFTPRSTVARFPAYLRELLAFDGVAAVSESSRHSLTEYWDWLGCARTPQTVALTLGLDPAPSNTAAGPTGTPTILSVGSIEARKNHLALLEACESLWSSGLRFKLRLVGVANAETGRPALNRLEALRAAGRPLDYRGPADDPSLERAYAECSFTVYPSLAEGYGLPVAESLARGKPCVCRDSGAIGEIARAGGCLALGTADPADIAGALRRLLESPADLGALSAAARRRRFKTWAEYSTELTAWMASLGPRA